MVFLLLLLLCGEEVVNAVHNTQRGTQKKVEKGLLFSFLTRPFSPFLIFYRTLHLETYALTRFFSKSASWCVFSLSLSSFSFIATTARGVKIYRERETNGETWNRRERNRRSDLEESFIFLVKRFCCKISSLQNQIIIALWKETNDDGFHVGQR